MTATVTRCPSCGRRLAGGSLVESLRTQLREAKLGSLRKDGEIERLAALLRETGVALNSLPIIEVTDAR